MKPFRYRIVVEWNDEDGVFVARVPALPGCAAHGKTAEQAAREARRAAEAMLAVLHDRLARLATAEGVSLNQLMVTLLAEGAGLKGGRTSESRRRGDGRVRQVRQG